MQTSSLLQYIKSWLRVLFSVKKETNRELNSSETFITQKKEYPYSGSHLDLDDFNGILYNAGFSFQVESYNKKSKEMLIKGSFDLSYYTQLHFTFLNVEFTTLEENEIRSDAWYGDQISILTISKRDAAQEKYKFSLDNQALVFKIHSLGENEKDERIVVAESMQYNFYLPHDSPKR